MEVDGVAPLKTQLQLVGVPETVSSVKSIAVPSQIVVALDVNSAIKPIPAFHFTNDNHKRDNAIAIKLIEHKTSDLIKENNFWGWPIVPEIGGFNVLSFLKRAMGETGYKVSFKDTHPNEKAHRLIAKELYDYSIQK